MGGTVGDMGERIDEVPILLEGVVPLRMRARATRNKSKAALNGGTCGRRHQDVPDAFP